ncbi:MAG: carboxypeptidase-like regulatory domain-containing protein [Flavobacteriaceae bacterium]
MKTYNKIFVLLSIVVITSLSFTKNHFKNTLGDPIPGVDVSLEQIPSGFKGHTQTDSNGSYFFKNISAGVYKLHFGSRKSNSLNKKTKMSRKIATKKKMYSQKNNNNNHGGIIIYAEDHNSSRSNLSYITNDDPRTPVILTVLTNKKLDLKKTNITVRIKIAKPVKILKGKLTR